MFKNELNSRLLFFSGESLFCIKTLNQYKRLWYKMEFKLN